MLALVAKKWTEVILLSKKQAFLFPYVLLGFLPALLHKMCKVNSSSTSLKLILKRMLYCEFEGWHFRLRQNYLRFNANVLQSGINACVLSWQYIDIRILSDLEILWRKNLHIAPGRRPLAPWHSCSNTCLLSLPMSRRGSTNWKQSFMGRGFADVCHHFCLWAFVRSEIGASCPRCGWLTGHGRTSSALCLVAQSCPTLQPRGL